MPIQHEYRYCIKWDLIPPDWRTALPRVQDLAEARRKPEAWTGMTRVGGADQPGEVTGIILLGVPPNLDPASARKGLVAIRRTGGNQDGLRILSRRRECQ